MSKDFTTLVGTIGSGLWLSSDGGENWRRVQKGLWSESRVYGLAVHPTETHTVFAGADDGVYKSTDGGQSFEHIDSPMNKLDVWKIAFDPSDPNTMFAGTRPAALFRSTDGGESWAPCRADIAEECPNVRIPRVTALTVDPADRNVVWAGVEVDGVQRSLDGGTTWSRIADGIPDPDIHDVTAAATAGKMVLTTTPREIFASEDKGQELARARCRPAFCAALLPQPGDEAGRPGCAVCRDRRRRGRQDWRDPALARRRAALEDGETAGRAEFADLGLCDQPRGPPTASSRAAITANCTAATILGIGWRKLPREFTEIRSIAWVPN